MAKFKKGDRVRLVSKRPEEWNDNGFMDKFLDSIQVIKTISSSTLSSAPVTFVNEETNKWVFSVSDIKELASEPSIQDILEECKVKYPPGTVYKSLNSEGISDVRPNQTIHKEVQLYNKCVGDPNGCNFVWANGKYAEIISTSEQQFKVGDWVIGWHVKNYKDYNTKAWQIKNIKYETVVHTPHYCYSPFVSERVWTNAESIRYATTKEVEEAQQYINLVPNLSAFKKEDFYNTKIDVSESPELSRLVQEKLFELGISWAGLSKQEVLKLNNTTAKKLTLGVSSLGKLMHGDWDNFKDYNERYPQDLGININNNNLTNKNNEQGKHEERYNGTSIKVRKPVTTISTGERQEGRTIQGKQGKTCITSGHLSYSTITSG